MNHEQFTERLIKSDKAVDRYAQYLVSTGRSVIRKPLFVAPKGANLADYQDDGDLDVIFKFEVKERKFTFTCSEDFKYPDAIVDEKGNFDKKVPRPDVYICFSADNVHFYKVYVGAHFNKMWVQRDFDRDKQREIDFYHIEKKYLHFGSIG